MGLNLISSQICDPQKYLFTGSAVLLIKKKKWDEYAKSGSYSKVRPKMHGSKSLELSCGVAKFRMELRNSPQVLHIKKRSVVGPLPWGANGGKRTSLPSVDRKL